MKPPFLEQARLRCDSAGDWAVTDWPLLQYLGPDKGACRQRQDVLVQSQFIENRITTAKHPTRSDTFLSCGLFFSRKRKIAKIYFSWVEPLKPTIRNLFAIWLKCQANSGQILAFCTRLRTLV